MPTPLVSAAALRDALYLTDFRSRRMALRKLVQPVLEAMFTAEQVRHLISHSPIASPDGEGETVAVRPTISGLRDQMDEATLIALAYSGTGLDEVRTRDGAKLTLSNPATLRPLIGEAILHPNPHGFPNASSKCGYAFGRPGALADTYVEEMRTVVLAATRSAASAPSPTPTTATTTSEKDIPAMPEALSTIYHLSGPSLDDLMNALDLIRLRSGVPSMSAEAIASMLSGLVTPEGHDRLAAAAELADMRHERPTYLHEVPAITRVPGEFIDAAIALMVSASTPTHVSPTATATATTTESTTMTKHVAATLTMPTLDPVVSAMLDAALTSAKLPSLGTLIGRLNDSEAARSTQSARIEALMSELKEASAKAAIPAEVKASSDGTIPAGKVTWVPAHKAFGLTKGKDAFGFDVPVWQWEGVHPHVPKRNPNYVFRPFELLRVLYALVKNKRAYLHGHTGTGKTTLIEQVAAVLNYPFMRLNFDSEISRMDLIGRDVLASEGGTTVSRFVDGILPQMMSSPCLGCFDEIDFVRPDIAYVMQRALEGDSLVITEDGGRIVTPHPMFRIFATGNTVGQGDEHGMYQGARVQSTALLDRFSVWIKVDYLKPADRESLIRSHLPTLADALVTKLNQYIGEHLEAFTTSKVLQPLSPRGFLALGEALAFYSEIIPKEKDAIEQALASTILDRSSVQDRVVLKGIADRVFG